MAPHERVYVDDEFAKDEKHGKIGCEQCHGGNPTDPDWKTAHEGVRKDPSYPDPSLTCGKCHKEIVQSAKSSLHMTLSTFNKMTGERATPDKSVHAKVEGAVKTHCLCCHGSCGQCHVSRPNHIGGGLLDSHQFKKKPPMQAVCTACHGSRIKKEYFGENKGVPPDVHKEKFFKCTKCHTGEEMHADGSGYVNRYDVENAPNCIDCHNKIYNETSDQAKTHNEHKGKVSCHVCHAMPYKNCYGCHVGKDDQNKHYYQTGKSTMNFKIGLNPLKSENRPEKYVTLRHVPVDRSTYDFYVADGLSRFDTLPTWKLATPHNIRRQTPQNKKCNNCHGNTDLFLSEKDVKAEYLNANKMVIVPSDQIPRKVSD